MEKKETDAINKGDLVCVHDNCRTSGFYTYFKEYDGMSIKSSLCPDDAQYIQVPHKCVFFVVGQELDWFLVFNPSLGKQLICRSNQISHLPTTQ